VRRQIIKAADRIDNLLDPLSLDEGLVTPLEGTRAKKLQKKKGKYISETRDATKILRILLPDGSYLSRSVQTAANISEQTLRQKGLTRYNWKEYFGNEDKIIPYVVTAKHDYRQTQRETDIAPTF
jgi:hypothetical protein